jgi:hypothetical protein
MQVFESGTEERVFCPVRVILDLDRSEGRRLGLAAPQCYSCVTLSVSWGHLPGQSSRCWLPFPMSTFELGLNVSFCGSFVFMNCPVSEIYSIGRVVEIEAPAHYSLVLDAGVHRG